MIELVELAGSRYDHTLIHSFQKEKIRETHYQPAGRDLWGIVGSGVGGVRWRARSARCFCVEADVGRGF